MAIPINPDAAESRVPRVLRGRWDREVRPVPKVFPVSEGLLVPRDPKAWPGRLAHKDLLVKPVPSVLKALQG